MIPSQCQSCVAIWQSNIKITVIVSKTEYVSSKITTEENSIFFSKNIICFGIKIVKEIIGSFELIDNTGLRHCSKQVPYFLLLTPTHEITNLFI